MQRFLISLLAIPIMTCLATADTLYSGMPSPMPPNVPSLGYEATSTSELGQGVQLPGGYGAVLSSASILTSNWAMESTYESL